MKMIERAIRNRWPISDELKAKIAERVSGIVEMSDSTRDVINAARVAIQADSLNAMREAMELDAEKGPEIHLHAHTGTEAARQVIESEPDYLEYLRNKALESGSSDS
jgi:cytosine/adenosine deaminase-related metal-dependent hydrolase